MKKQQGISAAAFMAAFSSAGVGTFTEPAPKPEQPKILMVDRWNGREWITVKTEWNGERYAEVAQ